MIFLLSFKLKSDMVMKKFQRIKLLFKYREIELIEFSDSQTIKLKLKPLLFF
jgi:hypothetical protein